MLPILGGATLLCQAGWRAFAAATPQAQKQDAARKPDPPFCIFVRKVVAAAPSEFAEFKGEEDTINGAVIAKFIKHFLDCVLGFDPR